MGEQEKKPSGKGAWIVRIVVIVILVLGFVFALTWRSVVADYKKAASLYEAGEYREAYDAFEAVQARPLAAWKVREQARIGMGRCKAEMATDAAFAAKTPEEWKEVVALMQEAIALAGTSEEYDRRLAEYTRCHEVARRDEELEAARHATPEPADDETMAAEEAPEPAEE